MPQPINATLVATVVTLVAVASVLPASQNPGDRRPALPSRTVVDSLHGAVRGRLKGVPKGTRIVPCRMASDLQSCSPQQELMTTVADDGAFLVSRVEPGLYAMAYALAADFTTAQRNLARSSTIELLFSDQLEFREDADITHLGDRTATINTRLFSGEYVVDVDAQLKMNPAKTVQGQTVQLTFSEGTTEHRPASVSKPRLLTDMTPINGSVQYVPLGLWLEFRDGRKYEGVKVLANMVKNVTIERWAQRAKQQ